MSDWSKPTTTSNYSTEFIQQLDARLKDLAYGLDPVNVLSYVGVPSGAVRINWGGADITLQSYSGSTWTTIPKTINMNAATATVLAAARNLVLSGDAAATLSSFNGSANVTATVTLTSVNAVTTTVGSSTTVPVLAFDTKGRVISVSSVAASNDITSGGNIASPNLTLQTGTGVTTLARLQSNAAGTIMYLGTGAAVSVFTHDTLAATLQNKTLGTGCVWNGGTVGVAYGGSGLSSYAIGDLVYASAATTLAKLADVATGNVLLSGGVGVAPSYGKVGLTTHVSGTLAVGNGGTGVTTITGILKGAGTGAFTTATGTDLVNLLGFAPVQNGTGTSQNAGNTVKIGWDGSSALRLQVDASDFGTIWPIGISGNAATVSNGVYSNTSTTYVAGNTQTFPSTTNANMAQLTGQYPAEVRGNGTGAAYIAFHRPSSHAVFFGLDTDNKLKVGGWSLGTNSYELINTSHVGTGLSWSGTQLNCTLTVPPLAKDVQTFTTSGTWTKPVSASTDAIVLIECWGGGGGGGSSASYNTYGLAGGGAGGWYTSRQVLLSSLAATVTVTIGSGGAGGVYAGNGYPYQGGNGGVTSFGSYLRAPGGQGGGGQQPASVGKGSNPTNINVTYSDTAYVASFSGSGAYVLVYGEFNRGQSTAQGGGGGGAGGHTDMINSTTGGAGGTSLNGGAGGAGGNMNTAGNVGIAPSGGGGGGGAHVSGGAFYSGGAGAAGQVRITVTW